MISFLRASSLRQNSWRHNLHFSRRVIAYSMLLVPLFSFLLDAQSVGSLSGTVRDTSGSILQDVEISISRNLLLSSKLTVLSDERGRYHIAPLQPGSYTVEIRLVGFISQIHKDVLISVNQQRKMDVKLDLSSVIDTTLEVVDSSNKIQDSHTYPVSRVLNESINKLPLNGRNFVDLVGLVPGAKAGHSDPHEGSSGHTTAENISIFGSRPSAISFIVDGSDNNHPFNGGSLHRFTQDSIEEFQVMTTGYEAEFGRAQGGIVNIITRSPSKQWFGTGSLFLRNNSWDFSNVPGQEVPELDRKQWSGSFGGPLRTEKTFFFSSFEFYNELRETNLDRSQIPTFLWSGLGTVSGAENTKSLPISDSQIFLLKFDHVVNSEHQFFGKFNLDKMGENGVAYSPISGAIALPSASHSFLDKSIGVDFREQWTVNSNTFVETKWGYTLVLDKLNSRNDEDDSTRLEPILHLLNSGFIQTNAPFGGRSEKDIHISRAGQNFSHFLKSAGGDHSLKYGWEWNHISLEGVKEITNDVEYSAAFLSSSQAEIMQNMFSRYGFQQAVARFFTISGNPDGSMKMDIVNNDISMFLQDKWSISENVTLNFGLRYDYATLFASDKNNISPRLGFAWNVFGGNRTVLRGGLGVFSDRNLIQTASTVPELGGVFTRSLFDVALPRLGHTYSDSLIDLVITSGFPVSSGGRTPAENPIYTPMAQALRGNSLALYDLLGINVEDPSNPPVITADNVLASSGISPLQAVGILESTYPGTDWEFWDVPGGSLIGNKVLSFFPRGPMGLTRDISSFDSQSRTPWTWAFNIGLEHQIKQNMIFSAHFIHRRSRDLLTRRIVNLFDVAPGNINFGKTTDGGPRINQVTYQGQIDYDGLALEFKKVINGWSSINIAYTASRGRDNLITAFPGSGFSNNNHPELDYGPSNQSVPHLLSSHGLIRLPFNINLSSIMSLRSGEAFNPRGIVDKDGDGLVDQRDTSIARNNFRTSSFFNVDIRLSKTLRINESQTLEVLFETYNLLNRANVSNVNSVSGPAFGVPNTFFPGREIQLGLRYMFGGN